MGEGLKQRACGIPACRAEDDEELSSFASFTDDDSIFSSSSDITDDEASSSSKASRSSSSASSLSSSQLESKGPLYELSSLMAQLPLRRGLSKYYQGKSQSFTSLSNARRIEDLPKKQTPYRRKMNPSKSYSGGMDANRKQGYAPGPLNKTISKKDWRGGSCRRGSSNSSSSSLLRSSKAPIPVHKNL